MSASQLRARLREIHRKPSQRSRNSGPNLDEDPQGDTEQTSLLSRRRSGGGQDDDEDSSPASLPRRLLSTFWQVLSSSWINVLLIFVPVGIISGVLDWPPMATFVLNSVAVIPLAGLISFATEELAAAVGPSVGGLLNATFGNAVELILAVLSLLKGEYRLIQSSVLGSVLVNILLVLGCCFIAGGAGNGDVEFQPTVTRIMSALLTLAASALVIPTILFSSLLEAKDGKPSDIMSVSRGTAVVLIIIYIVYLFFQLKSHSQLFQHESEGGEASDDEDDDEDEEVQPKGGRDHDRILSPTGSIICLVLSTICVGFCVEFLVDTVNDIVEETGMTKTFIGIILLPIISNAAEHVTAVVVSWKGKMNLALLVDLGSGLQITIFVTPFLIILAWIMGKDLTLQFQPFETIVFLLSVLVVNFLMNGGRANYLEGCMCVGWYVIIAIAFFYYPDGEDHV